MINQLKTMLAEMRPGDWVDVELTQCFWWVEHRPAYCDRGRFLWHCESRDNSILTIDHADGFPRYFFGLDALISEIQAWCEARSQEIVSCKQGRVGLPAVAAKALRDGGHSA